MLRVIFSRSSAVETRKERKEKERKEKERKKKEKMRLNQSIMG